MVSMIFQEQTMYHKFISSILKRVQIVNIAKN